MNSESQGRRAPSAIDLGPEKRFRRIVRRLALFGRAAAYVGGDCGSQDVSRTGAEADAHGKIINEPT